MCEVKGCSNTHIARGFCSMHYKRWQIHGDPLKVAWNTCHLSFSRKEKIIEHLLLNRRINGECWEWTRSRSHGYGHQVVDSKLLSVPRISAFLFLGITLNTELDICHHCDNPPCFNPSHLYAGTRKLNMLDRSLRGRHGIAKLLPDDVRDIRALLKQGHSHKSIAKRFSVSQATITNINRRKVWNHVE